MSRQDQAQITVTIDGRPLGVFDKRGGGGTDSEETKYRPGGMAPQKSLGGATTTENVTVERLYERERDHELCRWVRTRCGRATVVVSEQPLDDDGNPWGTPLVWRGKLKATNSPERDSEANGAATWTIEVSTEGSVS